jgi:catechol 2,3-dioxygenase-like lactoylglutathione lyase family enzyme
MARGIDHVVLAVHDLDAAASLYERLGFQVGGRNRHPWGTHNRVVQLAGNYVELLTVGEPERIPPHAPGSFSFGAFNRDFLQYQQGITMVALNGRGAADADAFRARGIGDFAVFDFERETRKADGSPARLAFSLAYAEDPKAPQAGFFTCQHHNPENFWNEALQQHGNTAATVSGVVLVAENPADHHAFVSAFADGEDGPIEVVTPATFRTALDAEPPDVGTGARLAAIRFAIEDVAAMRTTLARGAIEADVGSGRIVLGPDVAMGATLVFESGR